MRASLAPFLCVWVVCASCRWWERYLYTFGSAAARFRVLFSPGHLIHSGICTAYTDLATQMTAFSFERQKSLLRHLYNFAMTTNGNNTVWMDLEVIPSMTCLNNLASVSWLWFQNSEPGSCPSGYSVPFRVWHALLRSCSNLSPRCFLSRSRFPATFLLTPSAWIDLSLYSDELKF